ncbi:hypothetical protein PBI_ACHEBE_40 [Mycobacterium phage Achebe]|uniref:Uncharacterized protein n=1 Tax=Mycobacterium phage Backyardigan TaxID=2902881 RepID=G1BL13_9CAUD|nr:hypothetical protein WILE_41 [Mycobacterium phage Wile]YP_009635453.1 hypothetical protein FGG52_gp40 [Mycobacterium phage Backyardigan]AOT27548.1 hypothetical protein SEA_BADGER_40 [Mycobacterium phage Badger]APD17389.1 hypothetical protein PBI_ACHEBE_40 [Mycobacterium phage Achebe]ASZ73674.1 hypothetical protein SEA_MORPHER26_41 [Mycobacterium phage Morpher26]AZS11653.1 hypothetical protein SEA_CICI_41 [Mycobacterium phage Cici]QAY05371.1 hypothetical protein SEA_KATALIE136_41 [Mycobacte
MRYFNDYPSWPGGYVEISSDDSRSFITNTVLLRVTTRLTHEQLLELSRQFPDLFEQTKELPIMKELNR